MPGWSGLATPAIGLAGAAAVELRHEGRAFVGIGQHDHLADGTGQGDVEDAPLTLFVVAEAVGEQAP